MIKKILFSFLSLVFLTTSLTAQTLELITENEGVLEDGQVISVSGSPDDELIHAYVDVKNSGNEAMDVKVRRVVHEAMEGSVNMFCWGICYSASVDTSQMDITLEPGEVSSEFYGDYAPNGTEGVTKISYFVYDANNPDDETEVEVHYRTDTDNNSTLTLLTENEGELMNEQVITVSGSLDESMIFAYVNVRNDDELPIDVRVRRVENEVVEGTENVFCWGVCYSNTVDTSTMSINIEPGIVSEEFSGDYSPNENEGTSSISYYFYDERNPDNEIGVEVRFKVESTGIEEESFISGLRNYPVPADDFLQLEFKLREPRNASIAVYDMLGSLVQRKILTGTGTTLQLDTSGLNDGIYFYSIFNKGSVVATKKFVVAH